MDEPNVLLLDEPTNDLDIETLTALEDLLDGWPGSLIVVSHDRYFVERVCDQVAALLGDGGLRHLPGGVDEYLERRRAAAPARPDGRPVAPSRGGIGDTRVARKELGRIERQLGKLESRESTLHEQMAAHATDYERLTLLDAELRALRAEKELLEERWLELADEG